MIVTDVKWKDKYNKDRFGFYMQGYLKQNLDGIPKFLKMGYDCVGIVSGHGKVRIGKSTMAMQVGEYVAWILAGGQVVTETVIEGNTEKVVIKEVKHPKKAVMFDLYENVAFSSDDLQKKADALYKKYGPNQVIVYDEGRQGLDSARAMENINKGMQDFFQECGFMGHFILIVLPNFFKLHEDYAIARSLFLIDVFADKNLKRGYFNFYNESQKEKLFFFGKLRIGITAKYASASENFWGKFTDYFPFDRILYDVEKKKALAKRMKSRQQVKWLKQRNAALFLLKKYANMAYDTIASELAVICNEKIGGRMIEYAIKSVTHEEIAEKDDEDAFEEPIIKN